MITDTNKLKDVVVFRDHHDVVRAYTLPDFLHKFKVAS